MTDDTKAASSHDWTEDFGHDNGLYQNTCCQCGTLFIGHKRRVVCKVCDAGAAPSLADRIAQTLNAWPADDMILRAVELQEALAALRAVEAVRAYRPDLDDSDASYVEGYRHAVEAVQALLEDGK